MGGRKKKGWGRRDLEYEGISYWRALLAGDLGGKKWEDTALKGIKKWQQGACEGL